MNDDSYDNYIDLNNPFEEFEDFFAEKRKNYFDSLSQENQLLVFCEIVNKLVRAELENQSSYRSVLYKEFGFDTDAYLKAQISGFLTLHNSIVKNPVNLHVFGSKLLKLYGIEQTPDDIKAKISKDLK